jgi:uncharacterized peroxidase-related enzyme
VEFTVWDIDSAPEGSRSALEAARKKFGFVPNLLGVLAEAPSALEGYMAVAAAFEKSSLSRIEQQVVLLSTSVENRCRYCAAAHTLVARMVGAPEEVLKAIRDGDEIADPKLQELRRFTCRVVATAGWVSEEDVRTFAAAGYTRAQLLEVLVGVTQKTLSNYTNHIAHTPLDAAFAASAWIPREMQGVSAYSKV